MDEQNQIDRMLLDYIDENRDQLVEHVRQMVRIDSVEREARDGAPFGPGVKKALDLALSISRDMGFETVDSSDTHSMAGEKTMSAPWDMWMWCRPERAGRSLLLTAIWKTESYTAGEYWTIKGLCWPAFTGWRPLRSWGQS